MDGIGFRGRPGAGSDKNVDLARRPCGEGGTAGREANVLSIFPPLSPSVSAKRHIMRIVRPQEPQPL